MTILQPDTIFKPSAVLQQQALFGNLSRAALPADTKAVRMTLSSVYINRIREIGKGEVQIVSVVTDGVSKEPIQLSSQVYKKVKRKTYLPIGAGGLTLYRTDPAAVNVVPPYLDYSILIMEVDAEARAAGNFLDEVRSDEQFESFKQSLLAITAYTAPQIALIGAATDFTLNLIAKILKANQDDQLYLINGSFDNAFDDLGVRFGEMTEGNSNVTIRYKVEAA